MKLSELDTKGRKTYLFYGEAGAGKTVLATSFPGPMYVFDFDGKISSAAKFYENQKETLEGIEFDNYTQQGSKDLPYQRFVTKFNELGNLPSDKFPYATVVLDSITSFGEALMKDEMRQNASSNRSSMNQNKVLVPNMKDYQISINAMKSNLMALLSLPCNVVIIGHVSTDKDELTGAISKQVSIWGKELPGWIPKMVEECYHCYAEEDKGKTKYYAQTRQGKRYVARSQLKDVPNPLDITEGYKAIERLL
jgi:hypothetical protein